MNSSDTVHLFLQDRRSTRYRTMLSRESWQKFVIIILLLILPLIIVIIIIIQKFIKRKILSVETILSAYTHTNTRTGTRTHEHTDHTQSFVFPLTYYLPQSLRGVNYHDPRRDQVRILSRGITKFSKHTAQRSVRLFCNN